jgi:hypothetical protein
MESSTIMDSSKPKSSSDPITTTNKGVAGRINYAQWDKVTKELVTQIDEESQQEAIEEQKKVRYYYCYRCESVFWGER